MSDIVVTVENAPGSSFHSGANAWNGSYRAAPPRDVQVPTPVTDLTVPEAREVSLRVLLRRLIVGIGILTLIGILARLVNFARS